MFSLFLPKPLHCRSALLLRHRWRINKFEISRSTCVSIADNTNWRASEPCFQMKNMNFQQAAQKREGWAGGLRKIAVRAAEKSSRPARSFLQPSLMRSPLARPVVQPAGPPFCAARQPAENSCFLFGNTALHFLMLSSIATAIIIPFERISTVSYQMHLISMWHIVFNLAPFMFGIIGDELLLN